MKYIRSLASVAAVASLLPSASTANEEGKDLCAAQGTLVAMQQVYLDDREIRVLVTETTLSTSELPTRTLCFRESGRDSRSTVLLQTPDTLVSIFRLSDNDPILYSIWTTGSALRIRAFLLEKHRERSVLEFGTRTRPIFASTGDNLPAVVVKSEGKAWQGYIWNGREFEQARFSYLLKRNDTRPESNTP